MSMSFSTATEPLVLSFPSIMFSQKSGKAKLDDVTRLLKELKADLDASKLSVQQRQKLLEQLKVYGRSVDNSDPLFTEHGLRTLGRYAFGGKSTAASQEALRCIANALLLVPKTRQILVDLGHSPDAADKLKDASIDDEFLASRVLFLMTYVPTLDYVKLFDEHHLADHVNAAIARHAKQYSKSNPQKSQQHSTPMELMALSDTLKLLFNITHFHPESAPRFSISLPNIFKILVRRKLPHPPLDAPVNYLINALLNLDLEDTNGEQQKNLGQNAVFPTFNPNINAECLVTILDKSIDAYTGPEMDQTIAPILTLIRRIYEIAPEPVKRTMETMLLPAPSERDKPIGKSTSLASRLLNLTTSAVAQDLRGSISAMMFELSGKDPATFVHNIGYGFALGFLMSQKIPIPEEIIKAHGGHAVQDVPVNPITGQRLDKEEYVESEPMTEEEKEREAERLFVLFERLKATGVVDVKNPVEEMYQSGRIQELPDDGEEEEEDEKKK